MRELPNRFATILARFLIAPGLVWSVKGPGRKRIAPPEKPAFHLSETTIGNLAINPLQLWSIVLHAILT